MLVEVDGRDIPAGKDFDPATGNLRTPGRWCSTKRRRRSWPRDCSGQEFRVASLEEKPYTSKPYPPFTTSTMQQEANRKLGFTARRTMQVAQSLYENGHITYMRTDSTTLASVAVEAARQLVAEQYGPEYLPAPPRVYQTKVKNAQEAHEAIRPAGHPFGFPEQLRGELERRGIQALRSDLEAHRRQPDDRRPRNSPHRSRSPAAERRFKPAEKRSNFPAICGHMSKAPTIRRPT